MADSFDARDLSARLRRALTERGEVRLALLFGSRATGRAAPGSDVDLAVLAPGADLPSLAGTLSLALRHEVDVVDLEHATIPLLEALVRDGIVVHEQRRGAGAAWRARALSELETDRPWYRRMQDAWLRQVAAHGILDGR